MKRHTESTRKMSNNWIRRTLVMSAMFITSLVVAVTCALWFDTEKSIDIDMVQQGETAVSANNSYNYADFTRDDVMKNGVVKNFGGGTSYAVTIPRGQYKFEAWGAQGGTSSGGNAGGYGGYTYGTYTFTSTTTVIYIYVGSQGAGGDNANTQKSGGYNGGGSAYYRGSGGGGATHFALDDGALSTFSSKYSSRLLLVAGGGGGSQQRAGGAGAGGYNKNGVKCPSTSYGVGGCGGGTGGVHGDNNNSHSGSALSGNTGGFGQGGAGTKGGDGLSGGGGGGGFYGGCGVQSDGSVYDDKGGGGGSSYVNTSYMTAYGGENGKQSGGGYARITAISVNTPPLTKNFTVAGSHARGTGKTINVMSYDIAKDVDNKNVSASGLESWVYYTAGNGSNYDTQPANNAGLYLDSGCSKVASNYLNWTWNQVGGAWQQLTITAILKYPRAGVDGLSVTGQFTLYTKVRDGYGTYTTRGVSVISFVLNVTDNEIAANASGDARTVTKTGYTYRVGKATNTSTSFDYYSNTSSIYNTAMNLPTVFLPKPIAPTDSTAYTIYASDIYSDADTYDKVAFKSIEGTSAYYSITYNSDSTYASGLYPSITVRATGVRPPSAMFVSVVITAQSSETAAKLAIGSANTAVRLVFKIANTRPYFASTALINTGLREPFVQIEQGGTYDLSLSSFLKDIDDGDNLSAYFAQTANDLIVPDREYVQVDFSNNAVPLNAGNYAGKSGINTTEGSLTSKTGMGTQSTGFSNKKVIAPLGSAGADNANILYSYVNNQTIRFTARAATQNQYSGSGRTGHFYILVRVVDPSDVSDDGIWFPIAIEVTSTAPKDPTPVANVVLNFTEGSNALLTPVSYLDASGVLTGVGRTTSDDNGVLATPFVLDTDGFKYTSGNVLNDMAFLDGQYSDNKHTAVLDNNTDTDTRDFFTVTPVTLYASDTWFSMVPQSNRAGLGLGSASGVSSFYGLKITPIRSTDGEYFQFRVKVKDTHGVQAEINVCVKVENRAVELRQNPNNDAETKKINAIKRATGTPRGEYINNTNIGKYAVQYTIENGDMLQITPYDFAFDADIDPNNNKLNAGVYNTNPQDAAFSTAPSGGVSGKDYILHEYTITHRPSPSDNAVTSQVRAQQLVFANTAGIISNASQYSGYITTEVDKCRIGNSTFDIPCIKITGRSRTTSAIVQINFSITDGTTSVACLVTVVVRNSAPMLNPNLQAYYRISATPDTTGVVTKNVETFKAGEFATDKDGDIPTFVSGTASAVAKIGDGYYNRIYFKDGNYTGIGTDTNIPADAVVYDLSDYVDAAITKNQEGNDVVRIKGLSSTELFSCPIYLSCKVQDGFRAQPGESTLYLLIEVTNSAPTVVTEGLNKTQENAGNDRWTWLISYEERSEVQLDRYIFNSKELYDSQNVYGQNSALISVAASNKICLFDDADGQQNAILNPYAFSASSALINKKDSGDINSGTFTEDTYKNAAIIYNPMYKNNAYIDLSLIFFKRVVDGNTVRFTALETNSGEIPTCKYWAILIKDNHSLTDTENQGMQIAISVKDDHDGKILYTTPDKTQQKSETNTSRIKALNFYYNYKRPGIMAMHSYYRTDKSADASTVVGKDTNNKDVYLLDQRDANLANYLTDAAKTAYGALTDGDGKTKEQKKQEYLKTASFVDNFEYLYYVKTKTVENSGKKEIVQTYKHFQNTTDAFYYKPIEVGASTAGDGSVKVPMSYIALPQGIGSSSTEGDMQHVTFANATGAATLDSGNKLIDSNYASWGGASYTAAITENLTLTDGNGTWTGSGKSDKTNLADNPYITINYVAGVTFDNAYLNQKRGEVNSADQLIGYTKQPNYREDKYGFSFVKKTGGQRATGLLKLTLALKTVWRTTKDDSITVDYTATERVDVYIRLINQKPTLTYKDKSSGSEVEHKSDSYGSLTAVAVNMTMGDVAGKTVSLKRDADFSKGNEIMFSDPDATDDMKFYLSSASAAMSDQEKKRVYADYVTTNSAGKATAVCEYYNVAAIENIGTGSGKTDPSTYNPNPNYDNFFTVSPSSGSSSVLQFIPKAKTALTLPQSEDKTTYLRSLNLMEDAGGIYYPFRILAYDDCNNSAFSEGYWTTIIIKVYIKNDPIKVNDKIIKEKYQSSDSAASTYVDKPRYDIKLSLGTSYIIDVSSLLIDNDIVLTSSKMFATESDAEWSGLGYAEKYKRDYFDMPTAYTAVKSSANTPVTINYGQDTRYETMPRTTIIFNTAHAFKNKIDLAYTFGDSAGTSVIVIFSISYNNATPTPNRDTFGGGDTIEISMKTSDYFDLYAADSTKFADDATGGYSSYELLKNVKFPYNDNTAAAAISAETMKNSFKFDAYGSSSGHTQGTSLGSLVLGSDDAATTLRIDKVEFTNNSDGDFFQKTSGRNDMFTGIAYAAEYDSNVTKYMSLRVQARGVVNTTLKITLGDESSQNSVCVYIKINVISSAPTAKTTDLPNGLTYTTTAENVKKYRTSMTYYSGQPIKFALKSFMEDVDLRDVDNLSVHTNMDGTQFAITNPSDSGSVVTATYERQNSIGYVQFKAVDFINKSGAVAQVKFRIADAHGAVSNYVMFEIEIVPFELVSQTQASGSYPISLMSYADYIAPENASRAQVVNIVASGASAPLFRDDDVNAPSAAYEVDVFALVKKNENGTFSTIAFDAMQRADNELVYKKTSGGGQTNNVISAYVKKYFTVSIASNGKSLEFIPHSATLDIKDIPLYIEVKKHLYDSGNNITGTARAIMLSVSVANSKLVAVQNSPINSGYPMIGTGDDAKLREYDFLEFHGSTGDSLTWKLCDAENYQKGLFYDWDMRNLPTASGGKETINYIGYTVSGINESIKGKGDVLAISTTGTGVNTEVTVKINRKVFAGTPGPNGFENADTRVELKIYAADEKNKSAQKTDVNKVTVTTIVVYVENDVPEFATTGVVYTCPYCGGSHVSQTSANTALCGDCGRSFKSLDKDRLGYSLIYSEIDGYVLNASLENGKSLTVNIADIIDDADIAMDKYVLVYTGDSNCLIDADGEIARTIKLDDKVLFGVETKEAINAYAVQSLSAFVFTSRSTQRGAIGTCKIKIRDSVSNAFTQVLTVKLTVDNIAPTLKQGVSTEITMLGVSPDPNDNEANNEANVIARKREFNILDFLSDANGDIYDPTVLGNEPSVRKPTYAYIDICSVYMSDSLENKPDIYGPKLKDINERGEEYNTVDQVCVVDVTDAKRQKFTVVPYVGIYGVQKVQFTIWDGGYTDGSAVGIDDAKRFMFTIVITVANPLKDVANTLGTRDMVFGVTGTVNTVDLLGADNSKGYTIESMEEDGTQYLQIKAPDANSPEWRIYAATEGVAANVKVKFRAGNTVTDWYTIPVHVIVNHPPTFKNGIESYTYTLNKLDDQTNRTIKIYPEMWFEDVDLEDKMMFITPVSSSQTVKVEAVRGVDGGENGRPYILLKFNRRGEADITVTITDLSGTAYTKTVKVNCTDAPEMSWWESQISLIEENMMWFLIICGGVLAFIILLIVIIVVVCKKRKMRREIEALLESETELEEEMMRLSSGAPQFASFGYLPPTQQAMVDPGLMLGGGSNAPVNGSLQLNAGTGAPAQGAHVTQIPTTQVPPTMSQMRPTQAPPPRPQQPQQPPQQQAPRKPDNDGFNPDDF